MMRAMPAAAGYARTAQTTALHLVGVHPATLEDLAGWYARPPAPAPFRLRAHPLVLERVWELAGDWHRCTVNEDGSVTIHNQRAW